MGKKTDFVENNPYMVYTSAPNTAMPDIDNINTAIARTVTFDSDSDDPWIEDAMIPDGEITSAKLHA